jgi:hypothetical protein
VAKPREKSLAFEIARQPDLVTCGPTCLHGIYRYYGETVGLAEVMNEVRMLDEGGTLDVFLGIHARQRGYRVTLYSYNLQLFDPTWFQLPPGEIVRRLDAQVVAKPRRKLKLATNAYKRFLELGGRLRFADLRPALIRRYLNRDVPILTGLSATYLYQSPRELPETSADDDIRGEPSGHFVVLSGYDRRTRQVHVADPYEWNPISGQRYYSVEMHRLIGAVFLGSLTYDANLLVIEPRQQGRM